MATATATKPSAAGPVRPLLHGNQSVMAKYYANKLSDLTTVRTIIISDLACLLAMDGWTVGKDILHCPCFLSGHVIHIQPTDSMNL